MPERQRLCCAGEQRGRRPTRSSSRVPCGRLFVEVENVAIVFEQVCLDHRNHHPVKVERVSSMTQVLRVAVLLVAWGAVLPLQAQVHNHDDGRPWKKNKTRSASKEKSPGKLKVFVLAGQSNMEGHGNVTLTERVRARLTKDGTFERDKHNFLDYLAKHSSKKDRYRHLLAGDGNWAKRGDVWFYWKRTDGRGGPIKDALRVGLGAGESRDRIGPELQFGHVLGDHFDETVLLIKTAWGGKSLAVDFRPPSAGLPPNDVLESRLEQINERNKQRERPLLTMAELKNSYGRYYRLMIEEVDGLLENPKAEFPYYDEEAGYEIAGFVWFQGWNDGGSLDHAKEYAENFQHLVRDLRKKYGEIPVVLGTSGFGKNAPSQRDGWVKRLADYVEPAQIAACKALDRTEAFVTGDCLIPHKDRTSNRGIHHWFNSAETYFLIGDGLGKTMVRLLESGPN